MNQRKEAKMNKIKEMAEKYVEERRDLDVGHANAQFDCFNMIDAVEFGANYVLNEIMDCLPKTSAFNPNEVIDIITSKIKQLKEQ